MGVCKLFNTQKVITHTICVLFLSGSQIGQQVRRSHAYSKKAPVTIDDLPVPKGSWKELHAKRNAKYNAQLAFGAVFLIATSAYTFTSDVFVFNFLPPTLPPKN